MQDATAFEGAAFLGASRAARRDGHRLDLIARHLEYAERPLAFLPVQGATLVVTDRRVLELRPHLGIQGPWNVRRFLGFELHRGVPRSEVRGVDHAVAPEARDAAGALVQESRLVFATDAGPWEVLVARGPEAALTPEEVRALREAVLGPQPM